MTPEAASFSITMIATCEVRERCSAFSGPTASGRPGVACPHAASTAAVASSDAATRIRR